MARAGRVCKRNDIPCGRPAITDGYCATHAAEAEARRGSRHRRGYGTTHDHRRAELLDWLRRVGTAPCWRCGCAMRPGMQLDADHSRAAAAAGGMADRLTHASCNRSKRTPDGSPCPGGHA